MSLHGFSVLEFSILTSRGQWVFFWNFKWPLTSVLFTALWMCSHTCTVITRLPLKFLFCLILFLAVFDSVMARGCICCIKYMLFLFNLLFWVHTITSSWNKISKLKVLIKSSCVSAGRLWVVGRRPVALRVSGQLCHPLAFLPVALCRQPHHHPWQHRHGDRLFGLPGCH